MKRALFKQMEEKKLLLQEYQAKLRNERDQIKRDTDAQLSRESSESTFHIF